MPVLQKETSLFPEDLLEAEYPSSPNFGRSWYVLHTRPRAEKTLARFLLERDTSFFLPLYERTYRVQRRTVRSFVPLFPGYLFMYADDDQRWAAVRSRSAANCLAVDDPDRLRNDLKQVQQLITSKAPLAPEARLEPGMEAEIVHGPLKGHSGTVIRRGTGVRLVIEVNYIQQGVSVEVESTDIRPL